MAGRYDIDDVLARVDLRQLADELLGGRKGEGTGARWPSPTPGHPQTGRTPPMTIRLGPDGRERFHCWSTGARGTGIDLIGLVYGLTTADAIAWLVERAAARGAPVVTRPTTPAPAAAGRRDGAAIEAYVAMGERWLWTPACRGPLRYLIEHRGLDPEVLRGNRVGFDPGPRLEPRVDGLPQIAGITLPTFDEQGRLTYVQTRTLRPDSPRKYINPTSNLAVNPRLSWPQTTAPQPDVLVVCEGLIDALTAAALGYRAVAVLGTGHISPVVARTLAARPERLVLAFDNDPAGQHARTTLTDLLTAVGRDVKAWRIPAGHDLNSAVHTSATGARPPPAQRPQHTTSPPGLAL